jgi:hypothetical protein
MVVDFRFEHRRKSGRVVASAAVSSLARSQAEQNRTREEPHRLVRWYQSACTLQHPGVKAQGSCARACTTHASSKPHNVKAMRSTIDTTTLGPEPAFATIPMHASLVPRGAQSYYRGTSQYIGTVRSGRSPALFTAADPLPRAVRRKAYVTNSCTVCSAMLLAGDVDRLYDSHTTSTLVFA